MSFRCFSSPRLPDKLGKLSLSGLFVLITGTGFAATGFAQTTIQAREADRFVDSLGVNVHMEYANTPYQRYAAINQRLRELGMRHIRDEINDTDPAFVDELLQIGKLGYRLCGLIEGGNDYPPPGTRLEASAVVPMIHGLQPAIEAVEGPNEPDDLSTPPFEYDGVCDPPSQTEACYPQGAISESVDLWNIVKGNSEISALPVLVMSEGTPQNYKTLAGLPPPARNYSTYGNMHAYQGGGVGDSHLDQYIRYSRDLTHREALWTTEMGYHNNTSFLRDGEQQGVSQRAAAIYLPIAFLGGFDRGVLRTFSYELIDEFPEATHPHSGEGDYGLLNHDGTAKPAYSALRNLISLLQEPGVEGFEPGSLTIRFSGAPSTMEYTLLQKSNGDYYLALWNDVKVYKLATRKAPGKDVYPASVPMAVTFSGSKALTIYAPNDASGVNPTGAYTLAQTSRSITFELPAQVLLIKIADDND